MSIFKHFAVWATIVGQDGRLIVFTAIDFNSSEPEEAASAQDLLRAVLAFGQECRRSGRKVRFFIMDNRPRRWGEPGWVSEPS